jgi:hypothetical protein
MNLREAVEKARQSWRSKHGLCTMCGVGDRPSGGLHRGQYRCGNATSCGLCHGCMPVGEQCQCCYRIRMEEGLP